MSKICMKLVLKSSNETHTYEGKAIKKNNQIVYNDNETITLITFGEILYLERKKDYHMKMGFRTGEKIKGTYVIPEGTFEVETNTKTLTITENSVEISYTLKINNTFIDNFELILNYSIDT